MSNRINNTRLQAWAQNLLEDQECLEEVRSRFQMRMLERFRTASPDKRELINAIMDNEVAFWDEMRSIAAEIGDVNTGEIQDINNGSTGAPAKKKTSRRKKRR